MGRGGGIRLLLMSAGTGFIGTVVFVRYLEAWPLQPMYLWLLTLAFSLACLRLFLDLFQSADGLGATVCCIGYFPALLIGAAVFFAKDFYLPFMSLLIY